MSSNQLFRAPRRGFSMVEALTAVSVTAIAGAALLTSIGATVRSSTDSAHAAVARGLADQLMDEIAASRFPESATAARFPVPVAAPMGTIGAMPLSGIPVSVSRLSRQTFDDIDDYDGWKCKGPVDRQGRRIGTEGALIQQDEREWHYPRPSSMRPEEQFLQSFTREVQVERIRPDAGSGWTVVSQPTDYQRVTVRVKYTDAQSNTTTLAEISRIFSYVPAAP